MARRLAARGMRVRVFCPCGADGIYDGVEYRRSDAEQPGGGVECDVLVAWRMAPLLGFARARVRLLWCHDVVAGAWSAARELQPDRVLALSEWHKENLVNVHDLDPLRVHVTRNGIDLARFEERLGPDGYWFQGTNQLPIVRDPHRVIWSSSWDRGLQVLLDVWPQVRERVPDATLEVCYGAGLWERIADESGSEQQRYAVRGLGSRLRREPGVTVHGRVDQKKLAEVMISASAWVGSLNFDETSCISCMEAQAAGLYCVAAKRAAMTETLRCGKLLEGDWLSPVFQASLVEELTTALLRGGETPRSFIQTVARAHFSWDPVAAEWEALFAEVLHEVDSGVMPRYRGRAA
jgi:glycosyltransferase involved in cell wall biosynthesis